MGSIKTLGEQKKGGHVLPNSICSEGLKPTFLRHKGLVRVGRKLPKSERGLVWPQGGRPEKCMNDFFLKALVSWRNRTRSLFSRNLKSSLAVLPRMNLRAVLWAQTGMPHPSTHSDCTPSLNLSAHTALGIHT